MSLTTLSYYVRKALPFVIIVFVILGIFYFSFVLVILNNRQHSIVLNTVFGKIKRPTVQNKLPFPQNPQFTLDNIEGKPITATAAGQVFFVPPPKTKFGYLETIYLMAKSVEFDTAVDNHNLNNKVATFSNNSQTLSVDIANFNFEYETDYNINTSFFENPKVPDQNTVEQDAKEFLDKIGRYPDDLRQGTVNVIYLAHTTGSKDFTVVRNSREADVVEIDFFRPEVDDYPIVSPRYFNSQNFVVLTYPDGKPKIIKAQIHHFEKDTATVGAYPLITGDEAWAQFSIGKGQIIANQNPTSVIRITDMYLGYLDIEKYQPYIQPIYVFLGENNFVGWIEAIKLESFK
ncbi:hypothetical protein A2690_00085 [Candidatus Roizmanbacteria bacterium RIFCSPHIGHO2_01_FULL_39_12b]|uniref:Uncharacterized protein n=1 Tax=Candidatus Roizmanbacteria bacterium RIFCSPHIGHO2_01_FULL_39_12b TaxID=1802030 RepID=A0A1F7GCL7_9BACT|nr:MAG: hypothetical protein A2690_00085 [Candidatus Roizmanbacteria bacterium RIFCSPHIGHO2_01_FULL_39_12b]